METSANYITLTNEGALKMSLPTIIFPVFAAAPLGVIDFKNIPSSVPPLIKIQKH